MDMYQNLTLRLNRSMFAVSLSILFLLQIGTVLSWAQNPINVSVDQPNIWTLDQAHYLLAQMHRRNLDLKTPLSNLGDLDPNSLNGANLDVLRTLLSVSAEFDQSVGANNDVTRLNNGGIRNEKQFIAVQRRELLTKRMELQSSSLKMTGQIADLKIKLLRAEDEAEKKKLQGEIDELTIVQEVLKAQITQTTSDLQALGTNDKDYEAFATSSLKPGAGTPMTSMLAGLSQKISEQIDHQPQLNASVRLDNYIQMQYEILSKQLTLIRDEVGPGEKLVFLELPQSVNVSRGDSKNLLAQSWWKIRGYSECNVIDAEGELVPCSRFPNIARLGNRIRTNSSELVRKVSNSSFGSSASYDPNLLYVQPEELNIGNNLQRSAEILLAGDKNPLLQELRRQVSGLAEFDDAAKRYLSNKSAWEKCDWSATAAVCQKLRNEYIESRQPVEDYLLKFFREFVDAKLIDKELLAKSVPKFNRSARLDRAFSDNDSKKIDSYLFRRIVLEEVFKDGIESWRDVWQKVIDLDNPLQAKDRIFSAPSYVDRTIRTIDLFPKQGSLNVNDVKVRTSQNIFSGAFAFLTGIGGTASYERLRERYSQFVQQELYSSAFGKGSREFGWTFFPMPGTDRLLSGIRTTYAIAVIPEDTTALIFEGQGCYFPRSSAQPTEFDDPIWKTDGAGRGCSKSKTLIVPLPSGGNPYTNTFSVSSLAYKSVPKGEKAVVSIEGENFSSQIGIVIDGVALTPAIGLGQPFIRDDSLVGKNVSTDIANNKIKGTFERISGRKIVATFEMGTDYQGTPIITLISPGSSLILNDIDTLKVRVENSDQGNLREAENMFGRKFGTKLKEAAIEDVDVFVADQEHLRLMVKGNFFPPSSAFVKNLFINGNEIPRCGNGISSPKQCYIQNDDTLLTVHAGILPQIKALKVTLLTSLGALDSKTIPNPAATDAAKADPILAKYPVDKNRLSITSDPELKTCFVNEKKIEAVYKLSGKGFTTNTKAYIGNIAQAVELDGEFLILKVADTKITQKLLIQDPALELQDEKSIVLVRPQGGCVNEKQ
jgi:hypothetical protein